MKNALDLASLVFGKKKPVNRDNVLQGQWLKDAERMELGEIPKVDRDTWLKQKRREMAANSQ